MMKVFEVNEMTGWIDITQPLRNTMAVWPGDTPFQFHLAVTKEESGSVNIGEISSSTHIGTHADAPFHFDNEGKTIDQIDPSIYIGKAIVIDLTEKGEIRREYLENIDFQGVQRVLFKCLKEIDVDTFPDEVPYMDPEIGPFLKEKGIILIGIDSPSVDSITSKTLDTHHSLNRNGIHIIENLMLTKVEAGLYEFIALPLKIEGGDGSPVRAVVRKI